MTVKIGTGTFRWEFAANAAFCPCDIWSLAASINSGFHSIASHFPISANDRQNDNNNKQIVLEVAYADYQERSDQRAREIMWTDKWKITM